MKLFDTHVHLNNPKLANNITEVIEEAKANGVKKMVCIGYDMATSLAAIDIAYSYPGLVYASVGIHPTECLNTTDEDLERIENMLLEPCVVALGEIGLDYHWDTVEPARQKEIFIKQIRIAKKMNKPIIIHSREAINDTYEILKTEDIKAIGGIMHSYPSSVDMAKLFIDLNMYISLSGVVTFKNARKTKEVARDIDLKYLLLETDAPYLTPEPYRGKINYPQYTYYVAQEIALQKGISVDEVINATYNNAINVFKIK